MQIALRPVDVPVALRLVDRPGATFEMLHDDVGISVSTAHKSVTRLRAAGLVHPRQREVNRHALLKFLEHGVPYAFPAAGGTTGVRGVPTAHSAPPLASEIAADEAAVWPDPDGEAIGESVAPLYAGAVELPQRCPSLYDWLTLVDGLRIGRARERNLAAARLRERLAGPRR
jgi:hypothetical protein